MPIIQGIIASSYKAGGSFESIATVTVGAGGASSVSFSSIPSTYKHLQIRAIGRSSNTNSPGDYWSMAFNSNSTANGAFHVLKGDGSSAAAGAITNTAPNYIDRFANANDASGIFGVLVADILDYANTNKVKTWRSLSGYDANGSGTVALVSNLYNSTTAISQIDFYPSSGTFVQYSQFALYGVKG